MACTYCGSEKIRASQGRIEWCMSERCSLLHEWATYEPHFEAWMEPTPLQCIAGWLWYQALRIPVALLPIRWWERRSKGTWRYNLSYWFLTRSYWAYERAEGRA